MAVLRWVCSASIVRLMHKVILCASLLSIGLAHGLQAIEVKSPSGDLVLTVGTRDFGDERSCPFYRLSYKGRPVLADSRLGLDLEPDALATNLELASVFRFQEQTSWKPVCGERDLVRNHYHGARIDLREKGGRHRRLQFTCRAYDEGVAFCYTLPEQPGTKTFTITAERTQFAFTADHPAWAVYRAQASYAGGAVPISQIKPGAERPLTIKLGDDLYAAVTEARCIDYARMKLRLAEGHSHTLQAFLDAERGQAGKVAGAAPFTSPWRVIMAAESPGKLLEHNDLILNLNDPCALADTAWIKPGKVMRETTLTTAGGKACIDFCAQRGMQYILFDAGWYGPEGDSQSDASAVDPKKADRLNIQEVTRYGQEKGIGVILYVNRRALEKQMDQIFPLYEKWGVKGVKFGFVNVGSQKWTAWVHEGIRKAAVHHLMVDIHDEFRNTGYQRTYPNLMTVEGICGNEEFPTPAHNAALPFTRFLTGPADYTFCWYSGRLKVTHAHQLAISTIYFSPWQVLYWYDKPSQYQPDPALDYWKVLPVCWDETRVLNDQIGQCASIARRHGTEWFIGTINPGGVDVQVPLSFLEPGVQYRATIYSDRDPDNPTSKDVKIETILVGRTTVLKPRMPANGGQAVRIVRQ